MLDEYILGDVTRISPEAPVPVINVKEKKYFLGGAANVSRNIQSIGVNNYLIARIHKNDSVGKHLYSLLKKDKINRKSILEIGNIPTTLKSRILGNSQQICRVDTEGYFKHDKKSYELFDYHLKMYKNVDGIIIQDYGKGFIDSKILQTIVEFAYENNIQTLCDPTIRNVVLYTGVKTFKCNENEIKLLTHENNLKKSIKKISDKFFFEETIVTLGENGCICYVRETDEFINVPTISKEIVDVSGAGDTFAAIYMFGKINKLSTKECLELANKAAGVVVSRLGTSTVSRDDLLR